jgi:hypothetical protein
VSDRRVVVCKYGLWDKTTEHELYDAGSRGASLYEDKFRQTPTRTTARFVRATDWFREHLAIGDEIFMKLNCEGAEADIVEDLLDSGELARVRAVMIDPDVRKIPSQAHRERDLRERLRASGLTNYAMEEEAMVGDTHRERIQHWLRSAGAENAGAATHMRQLAWTLAEALRGRREPLRALLVGKR